MCVCVCVCVCQCEINPISLPVVSSFVMNLLDKLCTIFPGVKKLDREANHLGLSSVDIKNEWSHTSTPPISIRGVDRYTFTFTFY